MSREEAIESLRGILTEAVEFENSVCYVTEEDREPLEMAIKALEQEPCKDAISRQAVLELIADYDLSMGQVVKSIHALPSVTPQEPKTGHWIFDEILDKHYYCSECKSMGVDYWDYCPYCGAKMVESQEGNDKCKNCEYYRNPDYTRCHECKAESEE